MFKNFSRYQKSEPLTYLRNEIRNRTPSIVKKLKLYQRNSLQTSLLTLTRHAKHKRNYPFSHLAKIFYSQTSIINHFQAVKNKFQKMESLLFKKI